MNSSSAQAVSDSAISTAPKQTPPVRATAFPKFMDLDVKIQRRILEIVLAVEKIVFRGWKHPHTVGKGRDGFGNTFFNIHVLRASKHLWAMGLPIFMGQNILDIECGYIDTDGMNNLRLFLTEEVLWPSEDDIGQIIKSNRANAFRRISLSRFDPRKRDCGHGAKDGELRFVFRNIEQMIAVFQTIVATKTSLPRFHTIAGQHRPPFDFVEFIFNGCDEKRDCFRMAEYVKKSILDAIPMIQAAVTSSVDSLQLPEFSQIVKSMSVKSLPKGELGFQLLHSLEKLFRHADNKRIFDGSGFELEEDRQAMVFAGTGGRFRSDKPFPWRKLSGEIQTEILRLAIGHERHVAYGDEYSYINRGDIEKKSCASVRGVLLVCKSFFCIGSDVIHRHATFEIDSSCRMLKRFLLRSPNKVLTANGLKCGQTYMYRARRTNLVKHIRLYQSPEQLYPKVTEFSGANLLPPIKRFNRLLGKGFQLDSLTVHIGPQHVTFVGKILRSIFSPKAPKVYLGRKEKPVIEWVRGSADYYLVDEEGERSSETHATLSITLPPGGFVKKLVFAADPNAPWSDAGVHVLLQKAIAEVLGGYYKLKFSGITPWWTIDYEESLKASEDLWEDEEMNWFRRLRPELGDDGMVDPALRVAEWEGKMDEETDLNSQYVEPS